MKEALDQAYKAIGTLRAECLRFAVEKSLDKHSTGELFTVDEMGASQLLKFAQFIMKVRS